MKTQSRQNGLAGLRVLSLESRRAAEMTKLIESYGGRALVVPSMREVPLESNTAALEFARRLASGGFDMVVFLTGVGTRALVRVVETEYAAEQFVETLRKVQVVARGPKPASVLKELGVPVTLTVPEPNTWREVLSALDKRSDLLPLRGRRVAVQEYGAANRELLDGLAQRGAVVTRVPIYQWALPEDTGPLRRAVEAVARGDVDVALFTTSIQVTHLLRIAREMNLEDQTRRAFTRIAVGSIGPVTSEELREQKMPVDFEPEHPKMGYLVNEAGRRAAAIVAGKRGSANC